MDCFIFCYLLYEWSHESLTKCLWRGRTNTEINILFITSLRIEESTQMSLLFTFLWCFCLRIVETLDWATSVTDKELKHKLMHAVSRSLFWCIFQRGVWMLKVWNDHYYPLKSAYNTMATGNKCNHKMSSSHWEDKTTPVRTGSEQTRWQWSLLRLVSPGSSTRFPHTTINP